MLPHNREVLGEQFQLFCRSHLLFAQHIVAEELHEFVIVHLHELGELQDGLSEPVDIHILEVLEVDPVDQVQEGLGEDPALQYQHLLRQREDEPDDFVVGDIRLLCHYLQHFLGSQIVFSKVGVLVVREVDEDLVDLVVELFVGGSLFIEQLVNYSPEIDGEGRVEEDDVAFGVVLEVGPVVDDPLDKGFLDLLDVYVRDEQERLVDRQQKLSIG